MTKAKISEYDAVASNNTDVNGVNIAEGCPPSGMNNMGREIMAALKRFQVGSDGDGVTVGGNLVVSGSSTLATTSISSADINAGTIDGTAIGGSTPAAGSFTTLNTSGAVVFNDAGADVDFRVEGDTNANLLFVDASTDRVGIGTSTPGRQFTVFSNTAQTDISIVSSTTGLAILQMGDTAADNQGQIVYRNSEDAMTFGVNGSERARITSGGYLKASNTGSYYGSAGAYHEFNQSADGTLVVNYATNASYAAALNLTRISRSANSGYQFANFQSGDGADAEFIFRGDGIGYSDGGWTTPASDYAEYFESTDATAIPKGTTVVLENGKIRASMESDLASSIIGVIRPKDAQMILGNNAMERWNQKYLKDDFGGYLYDEHDVLEWEETVTDEEGKTSTKQHSYESHNIPAGITVPENATRKTHDEKGNRLNHRRLNPAYDELLEYTPREKRDEWNVVGLLGQVPVLKGQPVGDRWVKMRDVSETVEEWMIR